MVLAQEGQEDGKQVHSKEMEGENLAGLTWIEPQDGVDEDWTRNNRSWVECAQTTVEQGHQCASASENASDTMHVDVNGEHVAKVDGNGDGRFAGRGERDGHGVVSGEKSCLSRFLPAGSQRKAHAMVGSMRVLRRQTPWVTPGQQEAGNRDGHPPTWCTTRHSPLIFSLKGCAFHCVT